MTLPAAYFLMTRCMTFRVEGFAVLGFAVLGFVTQGVLPSSAAAHEIPVAQTNQEIVGPTSSATGIVFHDVNENQTRDEGEPALEGIKVSNGREIVVTDADGRYTLAVDDDQILFVIKPRNWRTPMSTDMLPRFFYIHKPAGSPPSRFPGVPPTGPLPASIDFPLYPSEEPNEFRALMFGDPQPRDLKEVDYIAHDVVAQIVHEEGHGAAFGVTLGDIAFDDLNTMEPLNRAIALIGIPWYNVIGNHDLNFEAKHDDHSDETFERIYGPNYYSFDHGSVHFMVLDDVRWSGATATERGKYVGGFGETQMEFIRNDLAMIPADQLVVLMMHIPLTGAEDRQELYRLIEPRPFALSFSAHTHYQEHVFITNEDGWQGAQPHHHVINVTVCGSWWRGAPDETGIPHATMSDGGPNGYSIVTFDGQHYKIEQRTARRPADYQMNIHAPEAIAVNEVESLKVVVNVFGGSEKSTVEIRFGEQGEWKAMERIVGEDPYYVAEKARENDLSKQLPEAKNGNNNLPWISLPAPHKTPHLWQATNDQSLPIGVHSLQVRTTDMFGTTHTDQRSIRVTEPTN
jgi:hypothetical protein